MNTEPITMHPSRVHDPRHSLNGAPAHMSSGQPVSATLAIQRWESEGGAIVEQPPEPAPPVTRSAEVMPSHAEDALNGAAPLTSKTASVIREQSHQITSARPVRDLLVPGQRVRVIRQMPHRDQCWTPAVEGEIVSYRQEATGSWYAHSKNHKLWLDRLMIQHDDGELTDCVLDVYTRIEAVNSIQPGLTGGASLGQHDRRRSGRPLRGRRALGSSRALSRQWCRTS